MTKVRSLFVLMAVAAGLVSCTESSNEYETLAVYPVVAGYHVIYADQTVDTITIYSTRDWEATCSANWFSMDPFDMSGRVGKEGYYFKPLPVYFSENITDKPRAGFLQVLSNGKGVSHYFMQTNWLNIEDPVGIYTDSEQPENVKATFTKVIDRDETSASIAFTFYNVGSLSSDATWAVPDSTTFDAGHTEITITCERNETGSARTANLKLKSVSGVSTVIQLQQKP